MDSLHITDYQEQVIWKVFKFKYLFQNIFDQMYDEELFGKRVTTKRWFANSFNFASKKYHQAIDVIWMIKNKYFGLLKYKLQRYQLDDEDLYLTKFHEIKYGHNEGLGLLCTIKDTEIFKMVYNNPKFKHYFCFEGLLDWACMGGNLEILDILFNQNEPFELVKGAGNIPDSGGEGKAGRASLIASEYGTDQSRYLYQIAVENGNINIIHYLKELKKIPFTISPNEPKITFPSFEIKRVKYQDIYTNSMNPGEESPLHRGLNYIIEKGYYELLQVLYQHPMKAFVYLTIVSLDQLKEFLKEDISNHFTVGTYNAIANELLIDMNVMFKLKNPSVTVEVLLGKIKYLYGLVEKDMKKSFSEEINQLKSFKLCKEAENIIELFIYLRYQKLPHYSTTIYNYVLDNIQVESLSPELIKYLITTVFEPKDRCKILDILPLEKLVKIEQYILSEHEKDDIKNVKNKLNLRLIPSDLGILKYLVGHGIIIDYNNTINNAIIRYDIEMIRYIIGIANSNSSKWRNHNIYSFFQLTSTISEVSNPSYIKELKDSQGNPLTQEQVKEKEIVIFDIFKLLDEYDPKFYTRNDVGVHVLWNIEWVQYLRKKPPIPLGMLVNVKIENLYQNDDLETFKLVLEWLNYHTSTDSVRWTLILKRWKHFLTGKILKYIVEDLGNPISINYIECWLNGRVKETKYLYEHIKGDEAFMQSYCKTYSWSLCYMIAGSSELNWFKHFEKYIQMRDITTNLGANGDAKFFKEICQYKNINKETTWSCNSYYPKIMKLSLQYYRLPLGHYSPDYQSLSYHAVDSLAVLVEHLYSIKDIDYLKSILKTLEHRQLRPYTNLVKKIEIYIATIKNNAN